VPVIVRPSRFSVVGGGGGPGGVQAWSWVKGDTGVYSDAGSTPQTSHDGSVQQWNDQSGNGNHWTQPTSNARPRLDSTNTLNGFNVLNFQSNAGPAECFVTPSIAAFTAGELWLVIKADANNGGNGFHTAGNSGTSLHYQWSDGNIYDAWGSTTRFGMAASVNSWKVYRVYSAATKWRAFHTGSALIAEQTVTVSFSGLTAPSIGNNSSGNRLGGRIAEAAIFDAQLSGGDATTVLSYFQTRFSI
jgi:hypothetical protein